MDVYLKKNLCTGCSACAEVCPKHCIEMKPDAKGFLYPHIDETRCVNCSACRQVCHTHLPKAEKSSASQLFAFIHPSKEVLDTSSSGGAFSEISQAVLNRGGYICGAIYGNDLVVRHTVSNDPATVAAMRGSKYVQSELGDCFSRIRSLLNGGSIVLFTGTPCQVIGLKTYLGKDYPTLYTLDFVCHSIPSPLVYRQYLSMHEKGNDRVHAINFRNKRNGWENYEVAVTTTSSTQYIPHQKDLFMRGFIGELYSRECCSVCPAKDRLGYCSDITLGDLWGAKQLLPDIDISSGVSAVICNTSRANDLIDPATLIPCDLSVFKTTNPRYTQCSHPNEKGDIFWKTLQKKGIAAAYDRIYKSTLGRKICRKLKSILHL